MRIDRSNPNREELNAAHRSSVARFGRICLVISILVVSIFVLSLPGSAQEGVKPKVSPKQEMDEPIVNKDFESARLVWLKKDEPIYKAIKDSRPLAKKTENSDEAKAFVQIIEHARQCKTEDLIRHPRWHIQYPDLVGVAHEEFLRDLIRIEGQLIRLRKIDATAWFKDTSAIDLYEGLVYFGNDSDNPVIVYLTVLPPDFKTGENLDERVIFEGYFFKTCPAPRANNEHLAPLLLGKTIRIDEREAQISNGTLDEAARVRLSKDDPIFNSVMDREPMVSLAKNYNEYTAYGLVFKHAHQFSIETLAQHSRKDIVFADLIGDLRDRYLRELLHVEGRLVRVRKLDANERLRNTSEIKEIYEGWIYHEYEYQHPIVVVFTDLPPEIKPGSSLSYRVAFDGYYFKLLAYTSKETDKDGKPVWRVTPLLIGRGLQNIETGSSIWSFTDNFVPMIVGLIGVVIVTAVGLTFWFRKGDRKIRSQMQEVLIKQNPFDDEPPPQVLPGSAWNRLREQPPMN